MLYVPTSGDAELSHLCSSILSDDERQRSARFAAKRDKVSFEQRRAFRRYCRSLAQQSSQPLSQLDFDETADGRPYVSESPSLWFSFSSIASGFLAAWSRSHAIGIDLQDEIDELEVKELADQFFSTREAKQVGASGGRQRLQAFYSLWCLKEAAVKSIGHGLPYGLDRFEFELSPKLRVVRAPHRYGGPKRFSVCAVEGTGAYAALIIRTP